MIRPQRIASALVTGLATFQLAVTTAWAQPSFEGQTIRIAVSTATGAPIDVLARQFAPFMTRHIPGKPQVVVENRPGAGGVVAANYIYNLAKPDGQTIGFLFGIVTLGLIGGDNIRYDLAKFHWLGAVSQTQVLLAHKDLNLSSFRDLLKPARPLVMSSSGTPTDLANRLFLDMIGAKYKYVSGYPGQAEAVLALNRGEATLTNAGLTLYLSRRDAIRKEGIYDAIVQRGEYALDGTFQRNKHVPEIPTTIEAIGELNPAALTSIDFAANRSLVAAFAIQYGYMLPPATPPAIVSTMRKAISDALNDPEARKIVSEYLKADYDFVDGENSSRIVEKIRAEYLGDPRIAERLKQLMASK
jgi:tripartite-type tricarboxylate transporter receptor subunit TctC